MTPQNSAIPSRMGSENGNAERFRNPSLLRKGESKALKPGCHNRSVVTPHSTEIGFVPMERRNW